MRTKSPEERPKGTDNLSIPLSGVHTGFRCLGAGGLRCITLAGKRRGSACSGPFPAHDRRMLMLQRGIPNTVKAPHTHRLQYTSPLSRTSSSAACKSAWFRTVRSYSVQSSVKSPRYHAANFCASHLNQRKGRVLAATTGYERSVRNRPLVLTARYLLCHSSQQPSLRLERMIVSASCESGPVKRMLILPPSIPM